MSAEVGKSSGAAMRELRQRLGYTQGSWGRRVGVSTATVCRWEAGSRFPTAAQVAGLKRLPPAKGADKAQRSPSQRTDKETPQEEARKPPQKAKKPRTAKRVVSRKGKAKARRAEAVEAEAEVLDAEAIGAVLVEDVERVGTAARVLAGGAQ